MDILEAVAKITERAMAAHNMLPARLASAVGCSKGSIQNILDKKKVSLDQEAYFNLFTLSGCLKFKREYGFILIAQLLNELSDAYTAVNSTYSAFIELHPCEKPILFVEESIFNSIQGDEMVEEVKKEDHTIFRHFKNIYGVRFCTIKGDFQDNG